MPARSSPKWRCSDLGAPASALARLSFCFHSLDRNLKQAAPHTHIVCTQTHTQKQKVKQVIWSPLVPTFVLRSGSGSTVNWPWLLKCKSSSYICLYIFSLFVLKRVLRPLPSCTNIVLTQLVQDHLLSGFTARQRDIQLFGHAPSCCLVKLLWTIGGAHLCVHCKLANVSAW